MVGEIPLIVTEDYLTLTLVVTVVLSILLSFRLSVQSMLASQHLTKRPGNVLLQGICGVVLECGP